MMVRFELKKVLGKTSSKITLLIWAGLILIGCLLAINGVEWTDEQGQQQQGHAAVMKLREAQKQWAGPLDEETLTQVILENQRIEATPEANSQDTQQRNIAFGWKQGIYEIWWLMNYAYADGFQSLDAYVADRVTVDMVSQFYPNRVKLLKDWLYDESDGAYSLFSEQEKQFLLQQYEQIETPFQYDYWGGWDQAMYQSFLPIAMGALVLTFLVVGFFSDEFRWKADAIYFSSQYGRTKATAAKIKAALLLITGLYWLGIGVYTAVILGYLGADGGGCPIQISMWKCFYNWKIWQVYLIAVVLGYIGTLFFALLTMWVSAKTKSAVFAVTIPFILILLPSMLESLSTSVDKVIGLLPDRLLQVTQCIRYFDVYSIGQKSFGALHLLPWIYLALIALLIPALYLEFRRKQIT